MQPPLARRSATGAGPAIGPTSGLGGSAEPERSVFVYGTLLFAEVFTALTGRVLASRPAELDGYRRYRVRGCVYPAIVAEPGAVLEGRVYSAVEMATVAILDWFEGALYARRTLWVQLCEAPRTSVAADAYVLAAGAEDRVSKQAWSPEAFQEHSLAGYIERCRRLRQEYQCGGSPA